MQSAEGATDAWLFGLMSARHRRRYMIAGHTPSRTVNPTHAARPRVLLADDQAAFRKVASHLLAPACDVVALACDGRQALAMAKQLRPEVVVLDVSMPELNGFEALEHLRRDLPDARVIFCTMHGDDEI